MRSILIALSFVAMGVASCQNNDGERRDFTERMPSIAMTADSAHLIGKRVRLIYPEYTTFESFQSDTSIIWTSIDTDGERDEGRESIHYRQIEENIHFISWINKEGEFVSQIIDTKALKVYTFTEEHSSTGSLKKRGKMVTGEVRFQR